MAQKCHSWLPSPEASKSFSAYAFEGKRLVNREQRQFEPCRHAQLVENIAKVMLDRVLADFEVFRNLFIRVSRHNRGNNFQLARSQAKFLLPRLVARRLNQRP